MGKKGGNRGVRIKQMGGAKGAGKMFNPMEDLAIPQEEMINLPPPPDRKYQIFWPIRKSYYYCGGSVVKKKKNAKLPCSFLTSSASPC